MARKLELRLKRPYSTIMDLSAGVEQPAWLAGAQLNIADSCFTAPSDAPAIVYQPEDGDLTTWTTAGLLAITNRVSNGLAAAGFARGDALACYMPMTAESVAIYLGIVRAGCVAVSIADSFAPEEIAKRLRLSNTKGILATSGPQIISRKPRLACSTRTKLASCTGTSSRRTVWSTRPVLSRCSIWGWPSSRRTRRR